MSLLFASSFAYVPKQGETVGRVFLASSSNANVLAPRLAMRYSLNDKIVSFLMKAAAGSFQFTHTLALEGEEITNDRLLYIMKRIRYIKRLDLYQTTVNDDLIASVLPLRPELASYSFIENPAITAQSHLFLLHHDKLRVDAGLAISRAAREDKAYRTDAIVKFKAHEILENLLISSSDEYIKNPSPSESLARTIESAVEALTSLCTEFKIKELCESKYFHRIRRLMRDPSVPSKVRQSCAWFFLHWFSSDPSYAPTDIFNLQNLNEKDEEEKAEVAAKRAQVLAQYKQSKGWEDHPELAKKEVTGDQFADGYELSAFLGDLMETLENPYTCIVRDRHYQEEDSPNVTLYPVMKLIQEGSKVYPASKFDVLKEMLSKRRFLEICLPLVLTSESKRERLLQGKGIGKKKKKKGEKEDVAADNEEDEDEEEKSKKASLGVSATAAASGGTTTTTTTTSGGVLASGGGSSDLHYDEQSEQEAQAQLNLAGDSSSSAHEDTADLLANPTQSAVFRLKIHKNYQAEESPHRYVLIRDFMWTLTYALSSSMNSEIHRYCSIEMFRVPRSILACTDMGLDVDDIDDYFDVGHETLYKLGRYVETICHAYSAYDAYSDITTEEEKKREELKNELLRDVSALVQNNTIEAIAAFLNLYVLGRTPKQTGTGQFSIVENAIRTLLVILSVREEFADREIWKHWNSCPYERVFASCGGGKNTRKSEYFDLFEGLAMLSGKCLSSGSEGGDLYSTSAVKEQTLDRIREIFRMLIHKKKQMLAASSAAAAASTSVFDTSSSSSSARLDALPSASSVVDPEDFTVAQLSRKLKEIEKKFGNASSTSSSSEKSNNNNNNNNNVDGDDNNSEESKRHKLLTETLNDWKQKFISKNPSKSHPTKSDILADESVAQLYQEYLVLHANKKKKKKQEQQKPSTEGEASSSVTAVTSGAGGGDDESWDAQKKRLAHTLNQWKQDFVSKNGKKPTASDLKQDPRISSVYDQYILVKSGGGGVASSSSAASSSIPVAGVQAPVASSSSTSSASASSSPSSSFQGRGSHRGRRASMSGSSNPNSNNNNNNDKKNKKKTPEQILFTKGATYLLTEGFLNFQSDEALKRAKANVKISANYSQIEHKKKKYFNRIFRTEANDEGVNHVSLYAENFRTTELLSAALDAQDALVCEKATELEKEKQKKMERKKKKNQKKNQGEEKKQEGEATKMSKKEEEKKKEVEDSILDLSDHDEDSDDDDDGGLTSGKSNKKNNNNKEQKEEDQDRQREHHQDWRKYFTSARAPELAKKEFTALFNKTEKVDELVLISGNLKLYSQQEDVGSDSAEDDNEGGGGGGENDDFEFHREENQQQKHQELEMLKTKKQKEEEEAEEKEKEKKRKEKEELEEKQKKQQHHNNKVKKAPLTLKQVEDTLLEVVRFIYVHTSAACKNQTYASDRSCIAARRLLSNILSVIVSCFRTKEEEEEIAQRQKEGKEEEVAAAGDSFQKQLLIRNPWFFEELCKFIDKAKDNYSCEYAINCKEAAELNSQLMVTFAEVVEEATSGGSGSGATAAVRSRLLLGPLGKQINLISANPPDSESYQSGEKTLTMMLDHLRQHPEFAQSLLAAPSLGSPLEIASSLINTRRADRTYAPTVEKAMELLIRCSFPTEEERIGTLLFNSAPPELRAKLTSNPYHALRAVGLLYMCRSVKVADCYLMFIRAILEAKNKFVTQGPTPGASKTKKKTTTSKNKNKTSKKQEGGEKQEEEEGEEEDEDEEQEDGLVNNVPLGDFLNNDLLEKRFLSNPKYTGASGIASWSQLHINYPCILMFRVLLALLQLCRSEDSRKAIKAVMANVDDWKVCFPLLQTYYFPPPKVEEKKKKNEKTTTTTKEGEKEEQHDNNNQQLQLLSKMTVRGEIERISKLIHQHLVDDADSSSSPLSSTSSSSNNNNKPNKKKKGGGDEDNEDATSSSSSDDDDDDGDDEENAGKKPVLTLPKFLQSSGKGSSGNDFAADGEDTKLQIYFAKLRATTASDAEKAVASSSSAGSATSAASS